MALIAGPTASGKSALALRVAEAADGIVINADASQVYRDLRILSARPSAGEEARVPHRLFGYLDGAEACTAARWAIDAIDAIDAAHRLRRLPVLVGGTGLYLRTLLDGIAPVPAIDPMIREEVRSMPVGEAHAALARADPDMAARLAPADTARIARALEVIRATGRSLADWQTQRSGGIGDRIDLRATVLLPPREPLFGRIDRRAATMLASGAVDEVEVLLARALPRDAPVLRAIGVAEIEALLGGRARPTETAAAIAQATRRYAKRQFTWFRGQPPQSWFRQESFGEVASHETLL